MNPEQKFLDELLNAIKEDKLTLPTLPEVALKIREVAEKPDVSANELAKEISNDAALAARFIKIANSPILRGRVKVDNVQLAVTRMGISFVKNLVTGLAMEQMFQATNDQIDEQLRKTWQHSIEVASICQVLATHFTSLKPDQAMLGGLVHEIGALPIITYAEQIPEILEHTGILSSLIERLHPEVGTQILQSWDFPPELVCIPQGYLNYDRTVDTVDYTDIVTVANLQNLADSESDSSIVDFNQVSAFQRLGLSPEIDVHNVDDLAEDINEVKSALV